MITMNYKKIWIKTIFVNLFLFLLMQSTAGYSNTNASKDTVITILPNEHWWAGIVNIGHIMPFEGDEHTYDLTNYGYDNQSAPLLLSDKGRFIWSEDPFKFDINSKQIKVYGYTKTLIIDKAGNTLKEAQNSVSQRFFPTKKMWVDSLLITSPQYNLWIELMYNPNEVDVRKYADAVLQNGWPAGVLMIDDNWFKNYGRFEFDKEKFPNPKKIISELHEKGFKVMLWVCPFITADSPEFRELSAKKMLLLDNEGRQDATWENTSKPLLIKWWNGYSAHLDLTNPEAIEWLNGQLQYLTNEYGVDGYKFDAGDPVYFTSTNLVSYEKESPQDQCLAWSKIGLKYPLNEYRASWKMGGQPLVQRLRDKSHDWEDVQKLIPHSFVQQYIGYTFICPDMIGGGEYTSFLPGKEVNQNLVVRSAQCSAFLPMMQFSVAPWRVLDSTHFAAVNKSVKLRQQLMPYIMDNMHHSVETGEPIIRSLEYEFPLQGFHYINDQFMLGDKYMVAPVVTANDTREVVFPKGKWKYNGQTINGPVKKNFQVALDEILIFEKSK
jgi:alpha-glucosidase